MNELWGSTVRRKQLLCKQRFHLFYDLTRSRIPQAICVNDLSIIKVDAELAKSASYYFHLYVRFFFQFGCHTGSQGLLDWSNRAVMDDDFLHSFTLLFRNEPTTLFGAAE